MLTMCLDGMGPQCLAASWCDEIISKKINGQILKYIDIITGAWYALMLPSKVEGINHMLSLHLL